MKPGLNVSIYRYMHKYFNWLLYTFLSYYTLIFAYNTPATDKNTIATLSQFEHLDNHPKHPRIVAMGFGWAIPKSSFIKDNIILRLMTENNPLFLILENIETLH